MLRYCFGLFLLLILATPGSTLIVVVSGTWNLSIGVADIDGVAGDDLVPEYDSIIGNITIDISDSTGDSDTWYIDVSQTDVNWDSSLDLYIRRSSDGSGTGSISGGSAFQLLTASDQQLFSGAGDRSSIGIQLRLSGVSVTVPPDVFTATVYFTVVDN